ncbi:hypothetical protein [Curvivirga sp.]|uniref:hypothetical protein n=1 Tax=Curvivirga sp. TaxID=2856848 RepID=UPI003B5902DA
MRKLVLPKYLKLLFLEWGIEFVCFYIFQFIILTTYLMAEGILEGWSMVDSPIDLSSQAFIGIAYCMTIVFRLIFLQIPSSIFLRARYASARLQRSYMDDYRIRTTLIIILITYAICYGVCMAFFLLTLEGGLVKALLYLVGPSFVSTIMAPMILYRWKGDLFEMAWAKRHLKEIE